MDAFVVKSRPLERGPKGVRAEHIVVHALSNNGYFGWIRLAKHAPSLGARLIATVFDCGIVPSTGGHLTSEAWFHIFSKCECSSRSLNLWAIYRLRSHASC